ncbi:hypothetical protein G6F60_000223 [Rhizopus arrhizus]|nr:hypothetical protein G6F60_000223 [Rhizopus arrhizus]
MQQVNGVPIYSDDPSLYYKGLDDPPTWFSAQGGVYRCKERSTDKEVAIKKYLVEENQHKDMFVMPKELVENEIYSMTKCVHPNILKLIAVYLHQEFVYLIMPLCTGGSLQHYVFEHQLTFGQMVYIIRSIASGLEKLHGHDYIHRDIKCDNIFLNQENNGIVIGDFGVVSISPTADSSVEEAGVALFWSPELVQQKIVNHKIDIWALGIVILEILNSGKAPYEDEGLEEEEIKQRILQVQRPLYPPNLPPQLIDLMNHCLDPDPNTRYSASQILQHPFLKLYPSQVLFPIASKKRKASSMPTKCRIPVRSFALDKSASTSIPVKEKILSVYHKRQSISDTNRSQGSRLPMLCVKQIPIEVEKKAPLVKKIKEKKQQQQALVKTTLKKKAAPNTPSTLNKIPVAVNNINANKPNNIPIKASIYRNKKPAGDSRTARLMMGISTARRQSYKTREPAVETNLPILAHKRTSPDTKKQAMNSLKGKAVLRVY